VYGVKKTRSEVRAFVVFERLLLLLFYVEGWKMKRQKENRFAAVEKYELFWPNSFF
jgi:hypothetical protein